MYALVPVGLVVQCESRKNSELDPRRISVLLYGSNDFDGTSGPLPLVIGFDNFAKCALAKQLDDVIL